MTLICSGKNVGENSVKTGLASAEALGVYRVCVCVCVCVSVWVCTVCGSSVFPTGKHRCQL